MGIPLPRSPSLLLLCSFGGLASYDIVRSLNSVCELIQSVIIEIELESTLKVACQIVCLALLSPIVIVSSLGQILDMRRVSVLSETKGTCVRS